jgi:hypothetical protein
MTFFQGLVAAPLLVWFGGALPVPPTPPRPARCQLVEEPALPRVVHLRVFNQSRLSAANLTSILDGTNTLWQRYGITLEAGSGGDAINVVVSPGIVTGTVYQRPNSDGLATLGSTLFAFGHATPNIRLWVGAAEALAAGERQSQPRFDMRTEKDQRQILVRMLGVALAHELGHYLLDSAGHSSRGLLRSTLNTQELENPRPEQLGLNAAQQQSVTRTCGG